MTKSEAVFNQSGFISSNKLHPKKTPPTSTTPKALHSNQSVHLGLVCRIEQKKKMSAVIIKAAQAAQAFRQDNVVVDDERKKPTSETNATTTTTTVELKFNDNLTVKIPREKLAKLQERARTPKEGTRRIIPERVAAGQEDTVHPGWYQMAGVPIPSER
jgi:hypothetical protein